MDRKEGPTLNILNKKRKKWHTLLCMSLFFCTFAPHLVETDREGY